MNSNSSNSYPVSPAKIGSQDGFRLPRAFSRDYPQLVTASGYVEVVNNNTLIVRLDPVNTEDDKNNDVTMSLFLDFLMKSAIEDPSSLIPYTEEMSQEANELLAGVEMDED
jgi:antitoxin PrlF